MATGGSSVAGGRWLLLGLALVAAVVLLQRLDGPLLDWDEAIYAEQAHEMLVRGDWLTPVWNFEPQFEKPPLVLWCMAGAFALLGTGEAVARGCVALFGVGVVLLTFQLGRRLDSLRSGAIAASLLLALPMFQTFGRRAMLDVPVALFFLWALMAFWRGRQRGRYDAQLGVALGLGLMAKGFPGLLALLIALAFAALFERAILRSGSFWQSVGWTIPVALPWHLAVLLRHGAEFWDAYVVRNVWQRASAPLEGNSGGAGFYFSVLGRGLGPYAPLVVAAVLWLVVRTPRERRESGRFLLVSLAVPFVAFSLIRTKLPWYAVPLLPVAALCAALLLSDFLRPGAPRTTRAAVLGAAAWMFHAGLAADPATSRWSWLGGALALVVLSAADRAWRRSRSRPQPVPAFVVGTAMALVLLALYRPPAREPGNGSARILGACVRRLDPIQPRLLTLNIDQPALLFYGGRHLETLRSLENLGDTAGDRRPILLACWPGECESLRDRGWSLVASAGAGRLFGRGIAEGACDTPAASAAPLVARALYPAATPLGTRFRPLWGVSMLEVAATGQTDATLIYFGGSPVTTEPRPGGRLRGRIPDAALAQPGRVPVWLEDGERRSEPLEFIVSTPPGAGPRASSGR